MYCQVAFVVVLYVQNLLGGMSIGQPEGQANVTMRNRRQNSALRRKKEKLLDRKTVQRELRSIVGIRTEWLSWKGQRQMLMDGGMVLIAGGGFPTNVPVG